MSKPKKSKTQANGTTPSADQQTEAKPVAEKAPRGKAPRLSADLAAKADRIIAKRDGKKAPKESRERQEDLVVFAFRLAPEERELIHKAAGAAKASRFVRALAVAAACGDEAAIKLLLQHTRQANA